MVAEVTVFPVPGGPWIRLSGRCNTVFTAYTCNTMNQIHASSEGTRSKMLCTITILVVRRFKSV